MMEQETATRNEIVHQPMEPYQPKHKIRVVTAASLFDGHDAAINIMRRIIQQTGAEVYSFGTQTDSVREIVDSPPIQARCTRPLPLRHYQARTT